MCKKGRMRDLSISRGIIAAVLLSLLAGCSGRDGESAAPMLPAGELYTLVNLHVDPKGSRIFTTNYQSPILLPLCTRVEVIEESEKAVRFRAGEQGVEYTYLRTKHLRASFADHLAKVFGHECVSSRVAAMNQTDRDGIAAGRAAPGMSKEAVILAMGYPPDHANPNLESDLWTFWRNKFIKMVVHFSEGVVSHVQ